MTTRTPTAEELLAAFDAQQAAWRSERRTTAKYNALRIRAYAIEGSEVLAGLKHMTQQQERAAILKLVRAERAAARRTVAEKGKGKGKKR